MLINNNKYIVTNGMSIFMWFFTIALTAIGSIFVYLAITQGDEIGLIPRIIILVAIPLTIIGFINYSLTSCFIIKAEFNKNKNNILITQRSPIKTIKENYHFNDIKSIQIEETKDSDGDSYFHLVLTLNNNKRYIIKEGHYTDYLKNIKVKIKSITK